MIFNFGQMSLAAWEAVAGAVGWAETSPVKQSESHHWRHADLKIGLLGVLTDCRHREKFAT